MQYIKLMVTGRAKQERQQYWIGIEEEKREIDKLNKQELAVATNGSLQIVLLNILVN